MNNHKLDVLLDNDTLTPAQKKFVKSLVSVKIKNVDGFRYISFKPIKGKLNDKIVIPTFDDKNLKEFKLRIYKKMIYSLISEKLINIPYGADHHLVTKLMLTKNSDDRYPLGGKIVLINGNIYSIPHETQIPLQNLYRVLMVVKDLGLL